MLSKTQKKKPSFRTIKQSELANLKDIVQSKNTILLLYADWCIHCNAFEPTWASLYMEMKRKPNVQLLAIEYKMLTELKEKHAPIHNYVALKNNQDDLYFPKLMVFKKGANGKGVTKHIYNGDRSREGLLKFIDTTFHSSSQVPNVSGSRSFASKSGEERRAINEQLHGASAKHLPHLIDQMISKYLGL